MSHVFPLIANRNVFQLWTLQFESHLWKPSSASLLYSSCDRSPAELPLVSGQSRASQGPAQHSSLWFDRTGQLINSTLIPNTRQQALFPAIFPFPRTSSATLDSIAHPPRLCAPSGWAWESAALKMALAMLQWQQALFNMRFTLWMTEAP